MSLVEINKRLYELKFNTDTGEHEDHSPFSKGQRSTEEYYCACKCDSSFSTYSGWKHHIGLKVHQRYRGNYQFLNKPLLDARAMIIEFKREEHKQENKYKGLKMRYKFLEKKLKDQEELENMIKNLEVDNQALKQKMVDIENYVMSDSDDEFIDCN